MKHNYTIDQHLRKSLRGYSVQPQAGGFERVMQQMEKTRRRRAYFWWWGCGGLAALLVCCLWTASETKAPVAPSQALILRGAPSSEPAAPERESLTASGVTTSDHRTQPVRAGQAARSTPFSHGHLPVVPRRVFPAVRSLPPAASTTPVLPPAEGASAAALNLHPEELPLPTAPLALGDTQQVLPLPMQLFAWPDCVELEPAVKSQLDTLALGYSALLKAPPAYRFLLGVYVEPQFSRFAIATNTRRSDYFEQAYGNDFPSAFAGERRGANTPFFSYAYGVKAGVAQGAWEIWLGYSRQHTRFQELLLPALGNFQNTSGHLAISYQVPSESLQMQLLANRYSVELVRNWWQHPWSSWQLSLGLHATQTQLQRELRGSTLVLSDQATGAYLRTWGAVVDLRLSRNLRLGKRVDLRAGPGLYLAPTSVFNSSYVLQQRPYGFSFQCLLVYHLTP